MPLARALCLDRQEDLQLAFARLALPVAAREYLLEKVPQAQLLLTQLTKDEGRFLRHLSERDDAPGREEFPRYTPGDARKRLGSALISGRREQLERVCAVADAEGHLGLASAVRAALIEWEGAPRVLELGAGARLALGEKTQVMGVVNVTPDSFSDGGQFAAADSAIAHGEALARAGAAILDVGGESTRPGAASVSAEEELRRVLPVLRGLRERVSVPLSIDTRKAEVAEQAIAAGASLVNDITGFQGDPRLADVVARSGVACCLMHIQGTPETMQDNPQYDDVVEEVLSWLSRGVERAVAAGVRRSRILVDPGIGFGKTLGHNVFLLRRLNDLRVLGLPILVGASRKGFLGRLTGGKPPEARLAATLGSIAAAAVLGGADVVRVHDVEEAKDALTVADAIRLAREGGNLWGPLPLAHGPTDP